MVSLEFLFISFVVVINMLINCHMSKNPMYAAYIVYNYRKYMTNVFNIDNDYSVHILAII